MKGNHASEVHLVFPNGNREVSISEVHTKWRKEMIKAISLDLAEENWADESKSQEASKRYISACIEIIIQSMYQVVYLRRLIRKQESENKG